MRALVYHEAGKSSWTTVPDPGVRDPGDAVVRVDVTTICGTDLHILKGDVPEVEPGTVLGHEAVGEVVETGPEVRTVRAGDRVLVSCISACGRCRYCREAAYGQCRGGGGWVLGHTIDGTQAEFVRVPFADMSLHPLPGAVRSEDAVLLSDIHPTAYEVGVLKGAVGPGDTVVVVGAGPIGLAAIVAARLFSPERVIVVDPAAGRLRAAREVGADVVADPAEEPERLIEDVTGGMGADVALEAVGIPESFELCTRVVRPGGRVANIGVHGKPVVLHLEKLWPRNVTITTGLVDTFSTPRLLRMLAAGRLTASPLVTHAFGLDRMEEAYGVFSDPGNTGALKVVIRRE
ncbi:alcohol dehydrogenase catalytic domain-containing protein [Streptomyces calidiresistens]|uniref:Alcohol dehydrogenase catalytic domain-containing protein n=1 Tax=Streptomyces calidiresistens TaxID=1485586 RepID=A0A7W3T5I4_9ACTN|nr:alcohol dehydrogenase catalytic domain-containing protein [Streptomyces calidiresistens]MBB0231302.1 alcohol dehydrogenase catalytic domain-containing protein [Streptomyces calidiresistens]